MVELTNVAIQTIAVGNNAVFSETPIPCKKGYVLHREGSGILTLRGCTNQCSAWYQVSFRGNIAVPTGETVGPISVAISLDGEALGSTTAIVTPAAVDEYFNVYTSVYVCVPKGGFARVAVKNTSAIPINLQNANIAVERVG